MDGKNCSICAQVKHYSEFYRDDSTSSGFRSACRKCHNRRCVMRRKQKRMMAAHAVDTKGPLPEDLVLTNTKRIIESFKQFRYGHSLKVGWRLANTLTARKDGLEFRRPTSDESKVILDFHTPKGETYHFHLDRAPVDKIGKFLALYRVEVIFP